jgi:2-dehydropantoate 2-reductase
VLNEAGLNCRISQNIAADVWRKLIYNCVVNPITALLGSEVGRIADPSLLPLKQLVIDECLAVAAAEGITFAEDLREEIDAVFSNSRNVASMQQDLRRGRPTEIDYMNGAVAALGAKHGLACPVNAALTSIIKAFERRGASVAPQKMLEPQPV